MSAPKTNFTPLVIVGAPRSGTNILRDALAQLPSFATWDCDEINPVWRHGHFFRKDDELDSKDLTPAGKRAISRAFARVADADSETRFVVEKTCANTLRLGYVDAALSGAIFLQIVRDGRDVVPSAVKRWRGEFERNSREYFLAKARHTPPFDLPLYTFAFVWSRLRKFLRLTDRLDSWGPQYRGIEQDMNRPLAEICALQWSACVERSDSYLAKLASERWMKIKYEDLVANPIESLRAITEFAGANCTDRQLEKACADVRGGSVGRGRHSLPTDERGQLERLMAPQLARHGYLEQPA